MGVSSDFPNFLGTPIILGTGKATDFKFGQYVQASGGPSEQKPIKNFGEKGVWAYPGTAQNFLGTPYYLRKGKSYAFHIWLVH